MIRLKYIVHYRESPDCPQWDQVFYDEKEANDFALATFLNGGISVTVTEHIDDEDDIKLGDTE